MVEVSRGKPQTRLQIFSVEIRHLRQNLGRRQSRRKQIKDIADSNAHPANARSAAALFGIDGDAVSDLIHRSSIALRVSPAENPAGFRILAAASRVAPG